MNWLGLLDLLTSMNSNTDQSVSNTAALIPFQYEAESFQTISISKKSERSKKKKGIKAFKLVDHQIVYLTQKRDESRTFISMKPAKISSWVPCCIPLRPLYILPCLTFTWLMESLSGIVSDSQILKIKKSEPYFADIPSDLLVEALENSSNAHEYGEQNLPGNLVVVTSLGRHVASTKKESTGHIPWLITAEGDLCNQLWIRNISSTCKMGIAIWADKGPIRKLVVDMHKSSSILAVVFSKYVFFFKLNTIPETSALDLHSWEKAFLSEHMCPNNGSWIDCSIINLYRNQPNECTKIAMLDTNGCLTVWLYTLPYHALIILNMIEINPIICDDKYDKLTMARYCCLVVPPLENDHDRHDVGQDVHQ